MDEDNAKIVGASSEEEEPDIEVEEADSENSDMILKSLQQSIAFHKILANVQNHVANSTETSCGLNNDQLQQKTREIYFLIVFYWVVMVSFMFVVFIKV